MRTIFNKEKLGFLEKSIYPRLFSLFLLLKIFGPHYSLNKSTTSLIMCSRVYLITVSTFSDLVVKSIYLTLCFYWSTLKKHNVLSLWILPFSPSNIPFRYKRENRAFQFHYNFFLHSKEPVSLPLTISLLTLFEPSQRQP